MHAGKGPLALDLMIRATTRAAIWVGVILLVTTLVILLTRANIYLITKTLKGMALVVIPLWIAYTCYRSKSPEYTFLGFCLVGIYGYYCLHHPTQRGSEHSLLPVLTGLIALPIGIQTLLDTKAKIPKQHFTFKTDERKELALLGSIVGSISGLMAGIGASSLVSALESKTRDDEDYVYLSTAAETANQLMAIALVCLIGMTRSGDAVLLSKLTYDLPLGLIILVLVPCMIFGRYYTIYIAGHYIDLVQKLPIKWVSTFVMSIGIASLYLTPNFFLSITLTLAGTIIGLACRKYELPNQVVFASMAFPVLVYQSHTTALFNGLLGFN